MQIGSRYSLWGDSGGDEPAYWGMYFEAEEPGVVVNMTYRSLTQLTPALLECSRDGTTWTDFDTTGGTTPVTLAAVGDRVYFRATSRGNTRFGLRYLGSNGGHSWTLSGRAGAHGNIMSLLDATNESNIVLPATYTFYRLFYDCAKLTYAPIMPATTLTANCYYYMYSNCSLLTVGPTLPATTLQSGCYNNMFASCRGLSELEVHFSAWSPADAFSGGWMSYVSDTGTLYCPAALGTDSTIERGITRCPANWTVVNI